MKSIKNELKEKFLKALVKVTSDSLEDSALIVSSQNPEFADYQSNIAMSLAKKLKKSPREIAAEIVSHLDVTTIALEPEIAGPGFINFKIQEAYIKSKLVELAQSKTVGISPVLKKQNIVVDFSGPNLAKEMHVGHLRSSIIGDTICRILEIAGHKVQRINHVGDWGTQFGMLIQYLTEQMPEALKNPESFKLANLEEFYKASKKRFDDDENFADQSRKVVVALQAGDPAIKAVWKVFCQESLRHCQEIYELLDIQIENMGESTYNSQLPEIVDDLKEKKIAVESQGAMCVFPEGYQTREGEPMPIIIQKSDGGYGYDTTDLAAIHFRVKTLNADKIIYITDARQKQHFDMVFDVAKLANYVNESELQHIGFGMMLGQDGKPFKTRSGDTIKLKDLLDEAQQRAHEVAKELSPDLSPEELLQVSKTVGVAGVKYSDLTHSIATDYKFSWEKMLSKDGNTAVYLLITYARTRSVGRKGNVDVLDFLDNPEFIFQEDIELQLAKKLLAFTDTWDVVLKELSPNILLQYLYEVCRDFGTFWNKCPIWKLEDDKLKKSRLALCGLVGKILKTGLAVVGIKALEKI